MSQKNTKSVIGNTKSTNVVRFTELALRDNSNITKGQIVRFGAPVRMNDEGGRRAVINSYGMY